MKTLKQEERELAAAVDARFGAGEAERILGSDFLTLREKVSKLETRLAQGEGAPAPAPGENGPQKPPAARPPASAALAGYLAAMEAGDGARASEIFAANEAAFLAEIEANDAALRGAGEGFTFRPKASASSSAPAPAAPAPAAPASRPGDKGSPVTRYMAAMKSGDFSEASRIYRDNEQAIKDEAARLEEEEYRQANL